MKLIDRRRFTAAMLGLVAALILLASPRAFGQINQAAEPGDRLGNDTPVVLIVLDELPTAHLMTPDGQRIDPIRYPQIAGFASGATWYRDNAAAGDFTAWAVPSILTGNLSNEQLLPTAEAQPDNIFTRLGPGRKVHSLEAVTELCPVQICPDGRQGEAPLAKFADDFIRAKFQPFDPLEIRDWIAGIPAGPGTLSFVHLKVPHLPLRYVPGGQRYPGGVLGMPNDMKATGWTADDSAISFIQQRHLLQTGYADRIVGRILRKVRENQDFDRAMVVLTADHGLSFDPLDLRRQATETNVGATLNPPLIIKYPGQTRGEVSSASTQSIDILPTIAGELGAEIPPRDGQLVSAARPDRVMTVSKDMMGQTQVTAARIREDRTEVLATQTRRLGARGLWQLGPRSHLIGKRPNRTAAWPGAKFKLGMPGRIRRADGSLPVVPSLVAGKLTGIGAGKVVALTWNGRIVATTRTFTYLNKVRFGAMVPPTVMKRGKNRVGLYLVTHGKKLRRIAGP